MEMKFAVTDAIAYTPKDGVRQARDAKTVSFVFLSVIKTPLLWFLPQTKVRLDFQR